MRNRVNLICNIIKHALSIYLRFGDGRAGKRKRTNYIVILDLSLICNWIKNKNKKCISVRSYFNFYLHDIYIFRSDDAK